MSKSRTNPEWTNLKVNDLVHPYFKGIWRIVKILPREQEPRCTPLVRVKKLATNNCKPCKQVEDECDISWCFPVPENTIAYAKSNGVVFD